MLRSKVLMALMMFTLVVGIAGASYTVSHTSVSMYLNQNTSTHVNETLTVIISNVSVNQYSLNRAALNLTLSNWQSLIGSGLVEHIINPKGSISNFKFNPGPPFAYGYNSYEAYIIMSYDVNNVTTVNQTSPRVFVYTMNSKDFNFEHGASGEILSPNTTLTIQIPSGSKIRAAYPLPDSPPYAFTTNYKNITAISWASGEPLSGFTLVFVVNESIRAEVANFFRGAYNSLGIYSYVIMAAVILGLVLYVYYRAAGK